MLIRPKILTGILLISIMTVTNLYPAVMQLDIWPYLKQLKPDISDIDLVRTSEIERHKENASELISKAVEEENREFMERAYRELFLATRDLFEIYSQHCKTERDGLPDMSLPDLDRPVQLERRAQEKINKSDILRNEAGNMQDLTRARTFYGMAFDLDQLALLNIARALRIYQDFPFVYAYKWEDDFTAMDSTPDRIIRVIETGKEGEPEGIDREEIKIPEEENLQSPGGLIYIIQIAAHINEIPDNELRKIYNGGRQVKMMHEDNWYKYYLGPYTTFEEAEIVMKSLPMRNVFVAAYYDGKRIDIGEARKIQRKMH
jgi:hypothetical protein